MRLVHWIAALVLATSAWSQPKKSPPPPLSPSPTPRRTAPPSYRDLKYPPLREIKLPQIATYTLANGMKLYLLENHELPLVSGVALIRTGNLFDPPGKTGLATLTGTVMRTGGTKSKTGDDLDDLLEGMGAGVEAGIGETSGNVSFNALKENTDEVLAVFRDILSSPEFRQDKLDLAKNQMRSLIARRNDDPHGIVGREFRDTLYGKDTPYGRRIEYATLDPIQRDDLVAFYKRYFFPANVMLAIQGDFAVAEMKAKIESLFAGWTYAQPPVPDFPNVTVKPTPGVMLAAKPDVTQTFFAMGHLGGTLRDKDYAALQVMGDILGGGFTSRLFKKVRTERGYAYEIDAAWGAAYDHPGLFEIGGSTKSASTVETLKLARQEVERLRTSEVTDEELKTAKDTVLNSFVFNFDRPSKTLNRLLTYEYFGYPKDFIFEYQKAVEVVTKADVLRVAKQHLHPDQFTIVAVGNPKEFGEPLSALGLPVKDIDLTIPEPKRAASEADAASLAKGRELLQRMQRALGGADKLAAIRDYTQSLEVSIQTPGGAAMKAEQRNQYLAPATFRQEQKLPFGAIVAFSNGAGGWIKGPQGLQPMPDAVMKQVRMEVFRLPYLLALSDRDSSRTVNFIGDGGLEISDQQGNIVKLYVDESTGLPVKQTYQSAGMGPPATVEESYLEWKEFDGIRVPVKESVQQNGKKFADVTVQEMKFNTGLSADELGKKP